MAGFFTIAKEQTLVLCKICMVDYDLKQVQKIKICNCLYCKECLFEYLKFEIMAGAYKITCPDAKCPKVIYKRVLTIVQGLFVQST